MAKKKMSAVTKSRIGLYGSIFVVLLACSLFINWYNRNNIQTNGMALSYDDPVAAVAQISGPCDLTALAWSGEYKPIFDSDEVAGWLREGYAVLVSAAKDRDAADQEYFLILGARDGQFFGVDETGASGTAGALYYRSYRIKASSLS